METWRQVALFVIVLAMPMLLFPPRRTYGRSWRIPSPRQCLRQRLPAIVSLRRRSSSKSLPPPPPLPLLPPPPSRTAQLLWRMPERRAQ